MNENDIGSIIVDLAIEIHQDLGPGLLESVYEAIMISELNKLGLKTRNQVSFPFSYKGVEIKNGFRADIVVENKVIIELKSVEALNRAHKKQLLTYLKLSGLKLGYILNFGSSLMKNGISRIINGTITEE